MKKILRILSAVMCAVLLMTTLPAFGTSLAAEDNETKIYNFARKTLGLNSAIATAIVANIASESNFNPTSTYMESDGHISYGICQWHLGRYDALLSFCKSKGLSYTSIDAQLQYLKYELENGEAEAYKRVKYHPDTADGAFAAAYCWATYFERCSSQYRLGRAQRAVSTYWPKYGNGIETSYSYPLEGTYYLKNVSTGKCLAVESTTESSKTEVVLKAYSDVNTQKFQLVKSYYGYILRPLFSKTYVVNPYASTVASGKNVTIYEETKDPSQNWYFVSTQGGFRVVNGQNPTTALDISGTTSAGNVNIKLSTVSSAKSQVFELLTPNEAKNGRQKPDKPAAILEKPAVKSGESVNVSWESVMYAESYRVVFKKGNTVAAEKKVDGNSVTFTSVPDGEYSVILYAVNSKGETASDAVGLKVGYYTVSYHAEGSDTRDFAQYMFYGEGIEVSPITPFIDGKNFLGWSRTAGSLTAEYHSGDIIKEYSSFDLYAVWEDQRRVYVSGDANNDGEVTMSDVLLIRKYIAGVVDEAQLDYEAADYNADDDITNSDLLFARKIVAGVF